MVRLKAPRKQGEFHFHSSEIKQFILVTPAHTRTSESFIIACLRISGIDYMWAIKSFYLDFIFPT